jgi:ankyrin repeat protein
MLRYYILLVACLTIFVINSNSEATEFLDLCGYTETPLMKATKIADIQEMYNLIQAGENVNAVYGSDFPHAGDPVLVYAINSKSLEAVTILLKAGANPNDFTNSSSMIYEADTYMNCRNVPLLSHAIMIKSPMNIITALIRSGANPNLRGMSGQWTPLMVAAYHGYTEAVKVLLSAGANKDEMNISKNSKKTALDYAKEQNNEEIIDILSSPSPKREGNS